MDPYPDDVAPLTYAQARARGFSRSELRGPLWDSPWRGVRVWSAAEASPRQRVATAALVLRGRGAIGGWGSACMLGADADIDGCARDGRTRLPVNVYPDRRLRTRPGLSLHQSRLDAGDVVVAMGVTVTSPVRTVYDFGRWAPDVREAVVAIDQGLRALRLDADALAAYAAARPRWRGAPQVRAALPLVDSRSLSPKETRLRLVWVLDARLGTPLVNHEIRDARGRAVLGWPDLLDPRTGLVGEYDGAQHRRLANQTKDNKREERLEGEGLTVVRATVLDLRGPELVSRLRRGQKRAHATPRGTWTLWKPSLARLR